MKDHQDPFKLSTYGVIRAAVKAVLFIFLVVGYVISTGANNLVVRDREKKLQNLSRISLFFTRMCLRVAGVKVNIKDTSGLLNCKEPVMIVSNHVSYLDIFVIASSVPSVFVASIDGVQEVLLIGTVTGLSGSVFVERKKRTNIRADLRKVTEILRYDINVVLFPESVTTNGETVLPFKSSFFASAAATGRDILAICLNYKKINGTPVDRTNRDLVCFYGDAGFFSHFFRMLTLESVEAEISTVDYFTVDKGADRKNLSERIHSKILECYETNSDQFHH